MKRIGIMATRKDNNGTHGCLPCQSIQHIYIYIYMVVNIDQTRIHLMPIEGDKTWETKGAKHIQVFGMKKKRQIITIVSSLSNGNGCLYKFCSTRQSIVHFPP
jgi:hypothetical protein